LRRGLSMCAPLQYAVVLSILQVHSQCYAKQQMLYIVARLRAAAFESKTLIAKGENKNERGCPYPAVRPRRARKQHHASGAENQLNRERIIFRRDSTICQHTSP
jgi:hypothetical protein